LEERDGDEREGIATGEGRKRKGFDVCLSSNVAGMKRRVQLSALQKVARGTC